MGVKCWKSERRNFSTVLKTTLEEHPDSLKEGLHGGTRLQETGQRSPMSAAIVELHYHLYCQRFLKSSFWNHPSAVPLLTSRRSRIPRSAADCLSKGVSCIDVILATQKTLTNQPKDGGQTHPCLFDIEKALLFLLHVWRHPVDQSCQQLPRIIWRYGRGHKSHAQWS